ncbi:deoxyuridine 5'-triphosphate nucleotidohydrolase, mitochondrial isoform X2 [Chrysemys picta bellii]|uniref:deoxyuridine 5'-triphosphate nucleotidohydrolase, mitochondrial isoform X2 n=1 Tax=Chrysemys picta bellii TaxID=8478 RepID=UPI0032B2902F
MAHCTAPGLYGGERRAGLRGCRTRGWRGVPVQLPAWSQPIREATWSLTGSPAAIPRAGRRARPPRAPLLDPAVSPSKRLKASEPDLRLRFAKLSENASAPSRGSARAAGYDLYSAYDYVIPAMEKAIVKTDIQISLPSGCYGRVAGVIDEDYRGNVGVVLFNFGKEDFAVKKGDRIAQLICERIFYPELEEVQVLDDTERGKGGFGSTGQN